MLYYSIIGNRQFFLLIFLVMVGWCCCCILKQVPSLHFLFLSTINKWVVGSKYVFFFASFPEFDIHSTQTCLCYITLHHHTDNIIWNLSIFCFLFFISGEQSFFCCCCSKIISAAKKKGMWWYYIVNVIYDLFDYWEWTASKRILLSYVKLFQLVADTRDNLKYFTPHFFHFFFILCFNVLFFLGANDGSWKHLLLYCVPHFYWSVAFARFHTSNQTRMFIFAFLISEWK